MHASLETLFTSYRQSGRPEPLGAVFDRSSPQLLAVALHLCAHPADGTLAFRSIESTFLGRLEVHPNLSPGTWHVDVTAADGRRFLGSFDVAPGASPPAPIHVVLAPVR